MPTENWIYFIKDAWEILFAHNWVSVIMQDKNLWASEMWNPWEEVTSKNKWKFYTFNNIPNVNWYHVPTADEWQLVLQMWMQANWLKKDEIDLTKKESLFTFEDRRQFQNDFRLPFAWWWKWTTYIIDDLDDHGRYRTATERNDDKWYALRLCGIYTLINDFYKDNLYSVRLFKDVIWK